jgi:hypothetical protein
VELIVSSAGNPLQGFEAPAVDTSPPPLKPFRLADVDLEGNSDAGWIQEMVCEIADGVERIMISMHMYMSGAPTKQASPLASRPSSLVAASACGADSQGGWRPARGVDRSDEPHALGPSRRR